MDDAPVSAFVLKMNEPRFSGLCFYPRALVGAVARTPALGQHNPAFLRSVNILCAERQLPSILHAAGGSEDVVVAATLVKLWPFNCRVAVVTIENHHAIVKHSRSIGTHATHY